MKTMKSIVERLKKHLSSPAGSNSDRASANDSAALRKWAQISVTDHDIQSEDFKRHLGGGTAQWDLRGRFQLFLLKQCGLAPHSRLLDVGCGPFRAGIHFVQYLEPGNYFGFDFNRDFIATARHLSEQPEFAVKRPEFAVVENFELPPSLRPFDFAIAFSVLNHCHEHQRHQFFKMLDKALRPGGVAVVSHAWWFSETYVSGCELTLTKKLSAADIDIRKWGWPEPEKERVFPIIELTRTRLGGR